ncbi:MAG: CopG family transcriptional regulator [Halobacteriales archaeon]|nr:CopG family transcriptional regulator [Halobacteriales archaeon]
MPEVELNLPDRVNSEIDRLVDQGDFLNREQAIEELLSMGMSAYGTTDETGPEPDGELFSQAVDDQVDPAMVEDQDEEYGF